MTRRSRIIPARAGFTDEWGVPIPLGTDHPRSRGVYYEDMRIELQVEGSSPLARGLLNIGAIWADFVRIIPARAGFT